MRNSIITKFEERIIKPKKHPNFRPGDTLRVHYKIEEAAKSDSKDKKYRIQAFEGVCIRSRKGGLSSSSFTVRKIAANSVGVERVFALTSPMIERIDIVSGGVVRRARLYYLRGLSGKAARLKSRRLKAGEAMTTVIEGQSSVKKEKKSKKTK